MLGRYFLNVVKDEADIIRAVDCGVFDKTDLAINANLSKELGRCILYIKKYSRAVIYVRNIR